MKITPRAYQTQAINALEAKDWIGLFEMATGTGKTFTSLLASIEYKEQKGRIFRIILVPYIHLMDQWLENCAELGIEEVISVSSHSKHRRWENKLTTAINEFNSYFLDEVTVISSYDTSRIESFTNLIRRVRENDFLIADECHNLGAPNYDIRPLLNIDARLGLSATPDRWMDDRGTEQIYKIFDESIYHYTLSEAIDNRVLVEYEYYPIKIDLTNDEIAQYKRLTKRLRMMSFIEDIDPEEIKRVIIARQKILRNAELKTQAFIKLIEEKRPDNAIVYTTPNKLAEITQMLGDMNFKVRKFNYEVSMAERQEILNHFAQDKLDILTAIKCLDEGVDVPSVTEAYLIASTSNPREFVQRRGRVLRRSEGKNRAVIFDFIVLPDSADPDTYEAIARKELPRYAEFISDAINKSEVNSDIYESVSKYGLTDLMTKDPWKIYQEELEKGEENYYVGSND